MGVDLNVPSKFGNLVPFERDNRKISSDQGFIQKYGEFYNRLNDSVDMKTCPRHEFFISTSFLFAIGGNICLLK